MKMKIEFKHLKNELIEVMKNNNRPLTPESLLDILSKVEKKQKKAEDNKFMNQCCDATEIDIY